MGFIDFLRGRKVCTNCGLRKSIEISKEFITYKRGTRSVYDFGKGFGKRKKGPKGKKIYHKFKSVPASKPIYRRTYKCQQCGNESQSTDE